MLQDKTGEIKSLWNAADQDIYNFNDENCINLLKSFPKIKEIKLLIFVCGGAIIKAYHITF